MKKLSNIIFTFLIFTICSQAQEKDSINYLTDFDFLFKTIKDNSIAVDIYCNQINVSFDSVYYDLRQELMANPDFNHFIESSFELFNLTGDIHDQFISYEFFNSTIHYLPEREREVTLNYVDTNSQELSKKYFELLIKKTKEKNKIQNIKTSYYSNDYYLTYKTLIGKKRISSNSKLVKINDLPIEDFINKNKYSYNFLYDVHNNTTYAYSLFKLNSKLIQINSVSFDDYKKNTIIRCEIDSCTKIKSIVPTFITINLNRIFYIKNYNTLYLRIVRMEDDDSFFEKLDKYRNESFERVVVDVRDNVGGNDMMWLRILSYFTDSTNFSTTPQICSKESPYLKEINQEENKQIGLSDEKIQVFENDIFDYIPDQKGKIYSVEGIYCLSNNVTFSSALAFTSLKNYLNNFKLISDNNPYLGGFGLTPLMFMMPNSKLIFRLSCPFDYILYKTPDHRVIPDQLIDYDIKKEIKMKNSFIRNYSGKSYCIRKNSFLNAILKPAK